MLHGYTGLLSGDRRRRLAVVLLLVNVSLIVAAALWRHAAADDPEPAQVGVSEQTPAAPQVELQAADGPTPPAQGPTTEADRSNDPVMEELRKVIRDPNSGLDIPRLDETSPLAASTAPMQRGDSDMRMLERLETVHALSGAALALMREARSLSRAGQAAESTRLVQHAAQLRDMIAAIAAKSDEQPRLRGADRNTEIDKTQ